MTSALADQRQPLVDAGRLAAAGPAVGEIHLDNDIDRHGGDVSDISGSSPCNSSGTYSCSRMIFSTLPHTAQNSRSVRARSSMLSEPRLNMFSASSSVCTASW